ncbi:MAG: UDP-N-acetylmuramoyl-tripeptide--D-alanyl-D-alanine ligase, partial [Elusimicrobiota bacterium]
MDLSKHWTLEKLADAVRGRVLRGDPKLPIRAIAIDSRRLAKGDFFWAIEGSRVNANDYVAEAAKKGALGALVTRQDFPGLSSSFPLVFVPRGINALGRFAAEHRLLFTRAVVVGVTGSNGKTTTKDFIAGVLAEGGFVTLSQGNFNNEIGCPLCVLELSDKHHYAVWELAARKKEDIAYLANIVRPTIAVLTGISAAHLETFISEDKIFETKAEILRGMIPGAPVIYWAEDPWLARMPVKWPGFSYKTFGFGPAADLFAQVTAVAPGGTTLSIFYRGKLQGEVRIPLFGAGPVRSALAAMITGITLGVPIKKIFRVLSECRPGPMRGEKIPLGGEVFRDQYLAVNDAYNANPTSMIEGVLGFLKAYRTGRRVVVMGEMRELGPRALDLHASAGSAIAEEVNKTDLADDKTFFVVTGGRFAQAMAEALKTCEQK